MKAPFDLPVATVLVGVVAVGSAVTLITHRRAAPVAISRTQRPATHPVMPRYGLFGFIEVLALLALGLALVDAPPGSRLASLVGVAFVAVAFMGGVWLAWIVPVNRKLAARDATGMSLGTAEHHRRSLMLHGVRLVLAIVALALLLMGLLPEPLE